MDDVPKTRRIAIRRGIRNFGLPVGAALTIWDLADGGLGDIARGGVPVAVLRFAAGVWMVVAGGALFGLFDYYLSRWLRGGGAEG